MAFQPVPETAAAQYVFTGPGGRMVNTFWFKKTGGWVIADFMDGAQAMDNEWQNMRNLVSQDVSVVDIYWRDHSVQFGPVYSHGAPLNPAGSNVNPVAPSNVTFKIKFAIPVAGRGRQGGIYVPGMPDTIPTGDDVFDGWANEWQDKLVDMVNAVILATGGVHVVVNRFLNGVKLAAGVPQTGVTITYEDLTVDSQRRRLKGRGQ